ncbi:MAG: 4-hydroxy-3-methylbut-2-enyl diphosphate reductase, partial [Fibrobacter sp.]|nr:4-hydroxy-3-methylbut-2-enyl diphosphate reductase [Fibrobacter sp.]
ISLIRNQKDIEKLDFKDDQSLAYITQTTLSVAETAHIIKALKEKFPKIVGPAAGDLCYATGNRQKAVAELSKEVDLLLVVGSPNSSNSSRLRELGTEKGIPSYLIDSVEDINPTWFVGVKSVGLSSGASAPEVLVQEVVEWIKDHFSNVELENRVTLVENTKFNLPIELQD